MAGLVECLVMCSDGHRRVAFAKLLGIVHANDAHITVFQVSGRSKSSGIEPLAYLLGALEHQRAVAAGARRVTQAGKAGVAKVRAAKEARSDTGTVRSETNADSDPGGAWHPDPVGRHELRWWDGQRWTDHVSDSGQTSSDPLLDNAPPQ